jgi:hypothetical protein
VLDVAPPRAGGESARQRGVRAVGPYVGLCIYVVTVANSCPSRLLTVKCESHFCSVVGGGWSVVGGRWGGRWSVVGGRCSVVGGRWWVDETV